MDNQKVILITVFSIVGALVIALIIVLLVIVANKQKGRSKLQDIYSRPQNKLLIGYYCGDCPVRFSPDSRKLGGSETAVVHLAREWQKMGYQVVVFGNVYPGEYEKVLYVDHTQFDVSKKMDILVLWRLMGCKYMLPRLDKSNYKIIALDLHDGDPYLSFPLDNLSKIDYIMLKSEYQKSLYDNGRFPVSEFKMKIIPNGVTDIQPYRKNRLMKKNPLKLVYTSCYLRGLEGILKYSWPLIIQKFPEARLHLFYGMELVDEKTRNVLKRIINKYPDSVIDHGRLERSEVRKHCADAMIHFYPCTASCEIDCISVKETALQGIIPVIPNSFVFSERAGIHFNGTPGTSEFFENAANTAIEIMGDSKNYEKYISKVDNRLKETVFSWNEIAIQWKNCFKN